MNILFFGIGFFLVAFFIHVLLWKLSLPNNHTLALLYIFLGVFFIALILFGSGLITKIMGFYRPQALWKYLQFSLLYISLSLAYIANYSAIEVDSPSLVMIMAVSDAGSEGLDKAIFEKKMTDDILVIPRIRDLVKDNMIYLDGNKYKLSPKGIVLAHIFAAFRKLLDAQAIGG